MVFFLPLDDPNEYDDDNGSSPGPGGVCCCCPDTVGCLVLDVSGPVLEVGRVGVVVLNGVLLDALLADIIFFVAAAAAAMMAMGGVDTSL